MLLMIVAFGGIMYFLMIRPQQKRAKEHAALLESISEDTRVLLTSGIFGTVRHTGERQLIVELAPGVEITVLKGNVARVVGPSDEEFVFTDDLPADEAIDAPLDEQPTELDRFDEIAANFERDDAPAADTDAQGENVAEPRDDEGTSAQPTHTDK